MRASEVTHINGKISPESHFFLNKLHGKVRVHPYGGETITNVIFPNIGEISIVLQKNFNGNRN